MLVPSSTVSEVGTMVREFGARFMSTLTELSMGRSTAVLLTLQVNRLPWSYLP